MDEFLISENPFNPERLFVLKNTFPRCLIECDFEDDEEITSPTIRQIAQTFNYLNTDDDVENWRLTIVQFFDGDPQNNDDLQKKYTLGLNDTWQWFQNYLLWDEKNTNDAQRNDYLGSVN